MAGDLRLTTSVGSSNNGCLRGGVVGGGDVNLGAGFGLPLPAEVHGGQSETQTQSTPSFSPVKDFVNGMRNWATSLAASRMGY